MPTRSRLRKLEKYTIMEFAGSADTERDMAYVRQALHDSVSKQRAEHRARQVAPVEWRTYHAKAAPDILRRAGLGPRAQGLLQWLEQHPGSVVVVCTMDVLLPRDHHLVNLRRLTGAH